MLKQTDLKAVFLPGTDKTLEDASDTEFKRWVKDREAEQEKSGINLVDDDKPKDFKFDDTKNTYTKAERVSIINQMRGVVIVNHLKRKRMDNENKSRLR